MYIYCEIITDANLSDFPHLLLLAIDPGAVHNHTGLIKRDQYEWTLHTQISDYKKKWMLITWQGPLNGAGEGTGEGAGDSLGEGCGEGPIEGEGDGDGLSDGDGLVLGEGESLGDG